MIKDVIFFGCFNSIIWLLFCIMLIVVLGNLLFVWCIEVIGIIVFLLLVIICIGYFSVVSLVYKFFCGVVLDICVCKVVLLRLFVILVIKGSKLFCLVGMIILVRYWFWCDVNLFCFNMVSSCLCLVVFLFVSLSGE